MVARGQGGGGMTSVPTSDSMGSMTYTMDGERVEILESKYLFFTSKP